MLAKGWSSVGRSVTQEGTLEEPCHRAITYCGIISYTIVFKEIFMLKGTGDSSSVRDWKRLVDDQNQKSDRNENQFFTRYQLFNSCPFDM